MKVYVHIKASTLVYSSIIHKKQKVETTQMSETDNWIKYDVSIQCNITQPLKKG